MIVSIKDLCEIFKVSHSKIYSILGRSEFDRFFREKIKTTRYFELNDESKELLKKWTKPRTKKDGSYEIDRGLMARIKLKELCEKYGYAYTTLKTILCRAEFDKYRDVNGRLIIWDKEAENKFLEIMNLKQGGGAINDITSRASI